MIRFCLMALAAGVASGPAQAAEATVRYRGTVEVRDAETLTIRRREGGSITVPMTPKTRVFIATAGKIRDIKPESYLGIVAVPGPHGAATPTQISIFSPSERGFEAGTKPWDTAPGATLTAGWIGDLSIDPPRRVELVYDGGTKTFAIPPGTPTAQIAPGERALLVPGAEVVAFVQADAQGRADADLVVVGRQGTVPTL